MTRSGRPNYGALTYRRAAKALRTHVMSVTSDIASHPEARITVPDGYKLLSGGAFDDWRTGNPNLLTASFSESDNTWRASGKDHIAAGPGTMTAYAIVTYDPDDIWDITQSSSTSSPAGEWPSQEVSVPGGYTMIGGGAQVHWSDPGNLLTASYPKDRVTWACVSKDHVQPSPATITAYVIGLKCNVSGLRILQTIQKSSSDPAERPTATASAPSGYVLVGGGAQTHWTTNGILLTASYPREVQADQGLAQPAWEARSTDHTVVDSGTIDVYAVSVKVVDEFA